MLREIEAFLAEAGEREEPDRVLATVLHARVPPGRRAVLRGHVGRLPRHRAAGAATESCAASFDGPARGFAAPHAIVQHARALGVEAVAGLHTGECEVGDGILQGLPLELAEGVAATATSGEVLVSSTVRDLVAGSGTAFAERGSVMLRDAEWRLFAATTARLPAP